MGRKRPGRGYDSPIKKGDIKGIVQDVRDGIIKNISIGYKSEQYKEKIGEKEATNIQSYRLGAF